jgi:two-component system, cell cycle response regulator DivK
MDISVEAGAIVLVADDAQDIRELLSAYLRGRGFRVETVADGLAAVERAVELHPDVILMDFAMLPVNGWEATERLKRDPLTSHIPIVALTAFSEQLDRNRAMQAGCDSFVSKPFDLDILLAEIRRVLRRPPRS